MNNTFLNRYCPNEGQGSRSSILWLCSMIIHSCYSLGNSFEWDHRKNGENISWVQHCQRIDAFKLWCLRRLLRVPWTARRSNQSMLKKINPEYSLEGLMLKLKLQHFGHLMGRADSLEKTLENTRKYWGQEENRGDRGWDGWIASPIQWTWVSANCRLQWRSEKPGLLQSTELQSWDIA